MRNSINFIRYILACLSKYIELLVQRRVYTLIMKSLNAWVISLFKDEFKNSESLGKWLAVIAVVNLPLPTIFVPYLTQAVTILLIGIFLKKYRTSTSLHGSSLVTVLCIAVMIIQLVWFPYISQLVTLVLLGVLYGMFTKYNKS